jgi:hypothetical protein
MPVMVLIRLLAVLVALLAAAQAPAQVSGGFFGIDAAQGMRLTVEPRGDGARGALTGPDGLARPFEAVRVGEGFEAMLEGPEGRTLLRVLPARAGARVVLAPVGEGGVLDAERMTALAFLRDGTALPPRPERYLPAPVRPVAAFDARAFVDSYPFWEAEGTGFAYQAVEGRYRAVIRMFPLVQADIAMRLCALRDRPAALGEALRGQGIGCDGLLAAERRLREGGGWSRFEREVAAERTQLLRTFDCADDLLRRRPECQGASDEVARRAVSMETVGTALSRYR